MEKMRYYLTAEPDPVVPLAGQLVQLFRVVVEQDVQDILVSQLDATLQKYMYSLCPFPEEKHVINLN